MFGATTFGILRTTSGSTSRDFQNAPSDASRSVHRPHPSESSSRPQRLQILPLRRLGLPHPPPRLPQSLPRAPRPRPRRSRRPSHAALDAQKRPRHRLPRLRVDRPPRGDARVVVTIAADARFGQQPELRSEGVEDAELFTQRLELVAERVVIFERFPVLRVAPRASAWSSASRRSYCAVSSGDGMSSSFLRSVATRREVAASLSFCSRRERDDDAAGDDDAASAEGGDGREEADATASAASSADATASAEGSRAAARAVGVGSGSGSGSGSPAGSPRDDARGPSGGASSSDGASSFGGAEDRSEGPGVLRRVSSRASRDAMRRARRRRRRGGEGDARGTPRRAEARPERCPASAARSRSARGAIRR